MSNAHGKVCCVGLGLCNKIA